MISRKGKTKQVKRIILAQDERNKPRPSIQKIMNEARSEESSSLQGFEEEESRQLIRHVHPPIKQSHEDKHDDTWTTLSLTINR